MSIELTGAASNTLSVKAQKAQGNDNHSVKNLVDSDYRVEDITIGVKNSEETQDIYQVIKKDEKVEEVEKKLMTTPQLENVAKQLQEFIGKMNKGLEFIVDEDSGRDVIKVIDKNSGDVIKQYPSEEVLSLVAKLSEATGNFVDSTI